VSQPRDERGARTGTVPDVRTGARLAGGESGSALTLTVAWARVISASMRGRDPGTHFDAFAAEHPHLLQKTLLRSFYSHARLMTWEAKRAFVEPDLLPLPDPI